MTRASKPPSRRYSGTARLQVPQGDIERRHASTSGPTRPRRDARSFQCHPLRGPRSTREFPAGAYRQSHHHCGRRCKRSQHLRRSRNRGGDSGSRGETSEISRRRHPNVPVRADNDEALHSIAPRMTKRNRKNPRLQILIHKCCTVAATCSIFDCAAPITKFRLWTDIDGVILVS